MLSKKSTDHEHTEKWSNFKYATAKSYDVVIKWRQFPRYWPFVRGIHRSPVNSPHKGQWRGALMLSLICVWLNGWINNREAGDLTPSRSLWRQCKGLILHYEVITCTWKRFTALIYGHLWGDSLVTGIVSQKGPVRRMFNVFVLTEQTVQQTVKLSVIWHETYVTSLKRVYGLRGVI